MILLNARDMSASDIRGILLEHDIRPTLQRIEIVRALLGEAQHVSADQLLARVNQQRPMVSKATIYNTLNLFVERGLVRQVVIDSGKVFYDSNTHVHHHLYNEDTGMLEDVDAAAVKIEHMPALPAGTVSTGIDVIIRVRGKP